MKKILLVGIYDSNTISLASHILRSYVKQFAVSSEFEISIKEFSIFSHSIEHMVSSIKNENPDAIGFSAYIWNINEILEIIKKLDATIIIGGPQVSGIEDELLKENPDIDIIATGEGEETFREILEFLNGNRTIEQIKGINTRDIKTGPRSILEDLNSIPSIYKEVLEEYPDISWISFETSRGCPRGCKFCTWSYSRKMRYYSLERIKKDLDLILSHDKIEHIYLCDSSLLLNKKRAKQILRHIINRGSDKTIRYEFSAEQLDDEIIDLLTQLPNHEFNFGIQSTNKIALHTMGRKFNRNIFEENYYQAVRKLKEINITVDLIYGLPGDDITGYKGSLNYALSLDKVKRILTNPLIVLPGSEFYQNANEYGIKLRDKKSYIVLETATFSRRDMELARKYSFYVSVIYLNYLLKDCVKLFAEWQHKKYIDVIIEFMESLPFAIVKDKYPDMVPSVKDGFEDRNRIFKEVINDYDLIVNNFKETSYHRYDNTLADYGNHYSDYFYKLKRFACKE